MEREQASEPSAKRGERTAAVRTNERLCGTESEGGGLHAGKTIFATSGGNVTRVR